MACRNAFLATIPKVLIRYRQVLTHGCHLNKWRTPSNVHFQFSRTFKTSLSPYTSDDKTPPSSSKVTCRENYHKECETLINKQINLELYASYAYLAMSYHFDREDVALPGFRKYFKSCSDEERCHAELLMKYQNMRGGSIKLEHISEPSRKNFASALDALIYALELEKWVYENLLDLHEVASTRKDPQLTDFIEGHFLEEQVKTHKELSDMITNLKRAGVGLGEYVFDRELEKKRTEE